MVINLTKLIERFKAKAIADPPLEVSWDLEMRAMHYLVSPHITRTLDNFGKHTVHLVPCP